MVVDVVISFPKWILNCWYRNRGVFFVVLIICCSSNNNNNNNNHCRHGMMVEAFVIRSVVVSSLFHDLRMNDKGRRPTLLWGKILTFDEESPLLVESMYRNVWTCQNNDELQTVVNDISKKLEELYKDPRQPNSKRFVWDPWVVTCGQQGTITKQNMDSKKLTFIDEEEERVTMNQVQYSLKRATCSSILNNNNDDDDDGLYEKMCEVLSDLGSSVGLVGMTPPWMSLYTTGDFQNFHTDSSHGPLAFVLSITTSSPQTYRGGETMLLQPHILNYWQQDDDDNDNDDHEQQLPNYEAPSIVRTIPTRKGRCIAFDPRIPHGVTPVTSNTNDPFASGRIVIHGWFREPQICWFGNAFQQQQSMVQQCNDILEKEALDIIPNLLSDIGRVIGYLAIRIQIDAYGQVSSLKAVCDTLQADRNDYRGIIGYDVHDNPVMEDAPADIRLNIHEILSKLQFPSLIEYDNDDADDDDINDDDIDIDNEEYERVIVVPFLFE